ncbi:hypothetical protein [Leucobacter ruminantium]|uniref:Uncharacterized protein n=1 Tax=Leucobacter ruminantium TaxID=1289170 RepID=A0A939LZM0_9MICO|nr:hypothetical protein [Leucobacter ruminantium]MBO1805858.1 hypothetical protein [Leucobacter ruminantium]
MTGEKTRVLIAEAEKHVEIVRCGNPRHTNFAAGCPECGTFCEWCGDEWPCLPRRLADALSALTVPDGDARERLADLLEELDGTDFMDVADAILAAFPVLGAAAPEWEWEYAVRWIQTPGQPITDIGADEADVRALVEMQEGWCEGVRRQAAPWEPLPVGGETDG